jgi:hypothetical protein
MSSELNPVVAGQPAPATTDRPPVLTDRVSARGQRGMVSAEWAVGIIAAIAIAGVLLAVVTAGPVQKALLDVILEIIATFTANL